MTFILNFILFSIIFIFNFEFVLLQSSSYAVDDFGMRFWEEDPPITGHNKKRPIAIEYENACEENDVETDIFSVQIVDGDIEKYKIGKRIGSGSYSVVHLAVNKKTGEEVVIKFLTKPNISKLFPREVLILSQVAAMPFTVPLLDVLEQTVHHKKEGAIVFPYIKHDPLDYIFANLKIEDIAQYMFRVLTTLDAAHERCIIHGDMKPINLLIDHDNRELYVSDWGLSLHYIPDNRQSYHIASRHWKAPELLFGFHEFNYAIDLWAVGIIMLEMLVGREHVLPAHHTHEQAALVARFVGVDEYEKFIDKYGIQLKEDWKEKWLKPALEHKVEPQHFDSKLKHRAVWYTTSMPSPANLSLLVKLAGRFELDEVVLSAIDLIEKLTKIDPEERLTASQALKHTFFKTYVEQQLWPDALFDQ